MDKLSVSTVCLGLFVLAAVSCGKNTEEKDDIGSTVDSERLVTDEVTTADVQKKLQKQTVYDERMANADHCKLPEGAETAGLRLRDNCHLLRLCRSQKVPIGEVSSYYGVEEDGKRYALSVQNAGYFFQGLTGSLWKDYVAHLLVGGLFIRNGNALQTLFDECSLEHPEWVVDQPKQPPEVLETLSSGVVHVRVTSYLSLDIIQADYLLDEDGCATLEQVSFVLKGPGGFSRIESLGAVEQNADKFFKFIEKYRPALFEEAKR
jgi:hypothetical protein